MSDKHSKASQARWAAIPKEVRIARMRAAALKKWSMPKYKKVSYRKSHAAVMVKGRKLK